MHFQKPFPTKTSTLSFWRTEPDDIDELRTTEDLPTECDVVIVGSGFSGASVAYHLLSDGPDPPLSVTMLEARQVCSGATGRNGGHSKLGWQNIPELCEKFGDEQCSALADFFLKQIPALKEVVEKEGIECDFALRRSFNVFYDEKVASSFRAEFDKYKHIPYAKQVDFVTDKYLEQITGVKGAKGAISVPVCSLWPYKLVCGLLKVSLGKGLNLQTNTYVTSVSQQPSKEGFSTIETSRGPMKARKILFATNGYTGAISPEYANVIIPWKGICSRTVVKSDRIAPNLSNTYNIHNLSENPEYMNPRPDGSIIAGGGKDAFEKDYDLYWNNPDDSTLIEPAKHYFDNYVSDRFVDYDSLNTSVENLWSGIMGRTVDGIPHVGTVPGKQNQFIMAGFNGGGMSWIFLAGKAMASMIRDDVVFEETGLPSVFKATKERLKSALRDTSKV